MKITKIGHCCLIIETKGKKIMTDPGAFTTGQNEVMGIDIILITHEHADHLHVESVKEVLKNNQLAQIFTNSGVGAKLTDAGIGFTLLEKTSQVVVDGLIIEAFDCKHEEIYKEAGQVQNTGYFIDGRLWYPGDSFGNPHKPVEVLALPVAGPWCRIADAITFALALKPKKAFSVHEGMIQPDKIGAFHRMPQQILSQNGIEFIPMLAGDSKEF
jgi:L-ascorbate metabolism protein UlaG (beta-lactamase superfamily)